MKKIVNPFEHRWKEGYNCFGCSPKNEIGLHLEFFDDDQGLIAKWKPRAEFEGYRDVVHGGIQSTLMDEVAAWVVYVKCETSGVTSNINVSFFHPLRSSKGEITIKARVIEQGAKDALIEAEVFDGDGKLCAGGKLTYFIYPQAIAKRKFYYPGIEAFYEKLP
jgi:uncharacterized protein (TIGR00369 family)